MTTADKISPALTSIYGDNGLTRALVLHLGTKIDMHEDGDPAIYGDNQRYDMIRETCWNWFSGGGTASIAAERVEAVLDHDPEKYSRDQENYFDFQDGDDE